MKKNKILIEIKRGNEIEILELDKKSIDFYKKETGHSKVTKRGINRFIMNLLNYYGLL